MDGGGVGAPPQARNPKLNRAYDLMLCRWSRELSLFFIFFFLFFSMFCTDNRLLAMTARRLNNCKLYCFSFICYLFIFFFVALYFSSAFAATATAARKLLLTSSSNTNNTRCGCAVDGNGNGGPHSSERLARLTALTSDCVGAQAMVRHG